MADTSDLVKRLEEADWSGTTTRNRMLIASACAALESAPTMCIEVDDAMVERALEAWAREWVKGDKTSIETCIRIALTAVLNPQQEKNNG